MKPNETVKYAVCRVSVAPVRLEGMHTSEMVTQLLFGETLKVINYKPEWFQIEVVSDGYKGWVSQKQVKLISESSFSSILAHPAYMVGERLALCHRLDTDEVMPLFIGSQLPEYNFKTFDLAGEKYRISGKTILIPDELKVKNAVKLAKELLGAPYLWGGRTISGIDCSGLTQLVFKSAGYNLPRNAAQQVLHGEVVDFVDEVQSGDLVFFDNLNGEITHVGIIVEPGKILHASGMVKIDKIDHFGIYSEEFKTYTHNLRIIKRLG